MVRRARGGLGALLALAALLSWPCCACCAVAARPDGAPACARAAHTGLHARCRRETNPLIGTYDISKIFQRRKPKPRPAVGPSAFSLRASSPGSDDVATTANSTLLTTHEPMTTTEISMTTELRKNKNLTDETADESPGDTSTIELKNVDEDSTDDAVVPLPELDNRTTEFTNVTSETSAEAAGATTPSVAQQRRAAESDEGDESVGWPVKRAAVVEGALVLGALGAVHGRAARRRCGRVSAGGLLAVEALLYALQRAQTLAPPGVSIGAHVLDDCDNDAYGLEMALDFIKGSISNIEDGGYACNATAIRKVISGVIGAASSVTSVQVANLLRLFKIPQVSYFSTSPELSNKARFEYFSRTIPSDAYQVRAMVEIIKTFGWKYISVVYEESNYGIKAFEELETTLSRAGICIAVKERLSKEAGAGAEEGAAETEYEDAVRRLQARARARGVVVWAAAREAARFMAAVRRLNASGQFAWLGSDGWSARAAVSAGQERAVEGAVTVQPHANPIEGFAEYFLNLTVENNQRNPWFVEYWEEHFQCRYPGSPPTPFNGRLPPCSGAERLTADTVHFDRQLQFVADAVYAFVYAIRDMHRAVCGGAAGVCGALRGGGAGARLLHFLRRARFTGLSGDAFRFDGSGDPPARYDVLHFRRAPPARYAWVPVGRYTDGRLHLRTEELQFQWGSPLPPESVCSAECELGQAKQYVEGESCCWHCFNCTQYEIRSPESETSCWPCPVGTLPDESRTSCVPLPAHHVHPDSPPALALIAFAALGVVFTAVVAGVWVARGGTPAVRASGRELSLVLLGGIALCYALTIALLQTPTDLVCALQRFGLGSCFTVVYAALLTKTIRIARIFAASRRSARRPPFISPKSQLIICAALVSVQVVVCGVWQAAAPARAVVVSVSRDRRVLACDSFVAGSLTLAFFYPGLLVVVCTVYAVITRNIPEAFNESKHIGFTMYTTCVLWLSFVPLYCVAARVPLRVLGLAAAVALSATVTLLCLFSPKLYIILWRPERNVRASLMPARWAQALLPALHAPDGPDAARTGPATPDTPETTATIGTPLTPAERPPTADREVQTDAVHADVKNGAARRGAGRGEGRGALQRGVRLSVTSLLPARPQTDL